MMLKITTIALAFALVVPTLAGMKKARGGELTADQLRFIELTQHEACDSVGNSLGFFWSYVIEATGIENGTVSGVECLGCKSGWVNDDTLPGSEGSWSDSYLEKCKCEDGTECLLWDATSAYFERLPPFLVDANVSLA